jgi:arabinose-5-phosphate isomerase
LKIQALQKLKKKIDNSFNKAVVEIAKCKSKVILCGVGKSGLIAAKISATLSQLALHLLIYLQVTPLMVI